MSRAGDLYGQSLYDLALSEGKTDSILSEMEVILSVFKENPDYISLLSEPSIPKNERLSLLNTALDGQVELYLSNFLQLLLEKGLLREYSSCYKRFRSCYQKDHDILDAEVISAVPLTEREMFTLKQRLQKKTGKTIQLKQKQSPDVLGGIKVELEGVLLDGTVQGRLSALRKQVSDIVV